MTSMRSNSQSEPAKIEQMITEFFLKSLRIILESRSPCVSSRNYSGEQTVSSPSSSSSSSSVRPRDKWFNLALGECPASLDSSDFGRQSYFEPLIIDVILVHRSPNVGAARHRPGQHGFLSETKREKIVERWIVQYESRKDSKSSGRKMGSISSQTYKRSIILLRSLYVTVRLLPAYKLIRELNSTGQIHPFNLTCKVLPFVEPFTRKEEAEMQHFGFVPVDTSCGRLCLSVMYSPAVVDVNSEPSTPISTQFITDYVGSPTTDPLKRFPYPPSARSPSMPSPITFARRHSWSNDLHRAAVASVSPSPSPTYSNSHRLPPRGHLNMDISPPVSSPHYPLETRRSGNAMHMKNMSFDESWPSPPFSPSPSPSPPTHLPSSHSSKALFRTESAPVSIPSARPGRSQGLPNHVLPPSPSPKSTRPLCSPHSENVRAQVPRGAVSQSSPSESKYQMNQDSLRSGEPQTGIAIQKVFSFGKDEVGNISGAKISSSSSPRISFSRSSSRLSFQDEFDDSEFACPFAVDDDDITDPRNRSESFYGKGHVGETLESGVQLPIRKSQDAAVGALVLMLKTAPPLGQEFSNSAKCLRVSKAESWSKGNQLNNNLEPRAAGPLQNTSSDTGMTASGFSRTAADAMEELRGYSEMKDLLLRRREYQSLDAVQAAETLG